MTLSFTYNVIFFLFQSGKNFVRCGNFFSLLLWLCLPNSQVSGYRTIDSLVKTCCCCYNIKFCDCAKIWFDTNTRPVNYSDSESEQRFVPVPGSWFRLFTFLLDLWNKHNFTRKLSKCTHENILSVYALIIDSLKYDSCSKSHNWFSSRPK